MKKANQDTARTILVCCGTGCLAGGSMEVYQALQQELAGSDTRVQTYSKPTGCNGWCEKARWLRLCRMISPIYRSKAVTSGNSFPDSPKRGNNQPASVPRPNH
jgi:NADH-quinone oxidoreductase subunit F